MEDILFMVDNQYKEDTHLIMLNILVKEDILVMEDNQVKEDNLVKEDNFVSLIILVKADNLEVDRVVDSLIN